MGLFLSPPCHMEVAYTLYMKNYSNLLLRIAIAFAFLYPAIEGILHPNAWVGFFPDFLANHFTVTTLMYGWGAFEIVIALWILSGKRIFIPSVLATLTLVAIVFFNFTELDTVFRDISLALVAAALAFRAYHQEA